MEFKEYLEHCPSCKFYLGEVEKQPSNCYQCNGKIDLTQRNYAIKNPTLYTSKILHKDQREVLVVAAAENLIEGEIFAIYGVFAVTTFGIECLTNTYVIDYSQFDSRDWVAHMSEKSWVNINDFNNAMQHAKELKHL